MKCEIRVTFDLQSDFHLGTGTGRGRTIDAQVLKDENGCPYVPGSSIKGLAKAHAEFTLVPAIREFDVDGIRLQDLDTAKTASLFAATFGSKGVGRGWFSFHDARLGGGDSARPSVVGRSTRDRVSGTTQETKLFFNELAAGTKFESTVEAECLPRDANGIKAILLVLLALRRIEALGGTRRRGLGRCSVSVEVIEGPESLKGKALGACADRFQPDGDGDTGWISELLTTSAPPAFASDSGSSVTVHNMDDTTWTCLPLFAEALAPLVLAADLGAENIITSLDYIPGSTIRGAAAWWLLKNGMSDADDAFQQLIVREQLQFGPLYPLQSFWLRRQTMPFPVPLSFVECKYQPGELRGDDSAPHAHGVTDRHFHPDASECGCGEPLTGRDGWSVLVRPSASDDLHELRLWQSKLQTIQRTEIDSRDTQRAKANQLYATESIAAGAWFAGYVWGPKWGIDLLANSVFRDQRIFQIGKSRSRGHGKLCVWREQIDRQGPEYAQSRDAVYPIIYASEALAATPPDDGFTLLCYSDLIAIDDFLRPLTLLSADALWCLVRRQPVRSQESIPFECASSYVRTVRVSGFNGKAQLPRSADTAIAAGSTWRLRWVTDDETRRKRAWKLLLRAHREGLGLRRGEGFGRIMLNPPIHAIVAAQNASIRGENQTPAGASFRANVHTVAAIPCSTAFRQVQPRELARRARHNQARIDELVGDCDCAVRAAVARLLWQQSWVDNPLDALKLLADDLASGSTSTYPLPLGKPESPRSNLAQWLKEVANAGRSTDAPQFLQRLAESLEAAANRSDEDR